MDGIINIYKEAGYTSADVVAKLRGILRQKKIGHTGTLDPEKKTYRAVLLLGRETDTQDTTGTTVHETDFGAFLGETGQTAEAFARKLSETAAGFVGDYMQVPPMYSALKVNGKRLYELARKGIEVERKPRLQHIYRIDIDRVDLPRAELTVECSRGTYIRTLCHDIGQKLGCGGCMESLLRTRVGTFDLHDALTIGEIEKLKKEENGSAGEAAGHNSPAYTFIRSVDSFYSDLPAITVRNEALPGVLNGGPAASEDVRTEEKAPGGSEVRAYTEDGAFIGVYRASEDASYRLVKYYYDNK